MVDTDIEDLRKFGQKVRRTKSSTVPSKKVFFIHKKHIFCLVRIIFIMPLRKIFSINQYVFIRLFKWFCSLRMCFTHGLKNKQILKNHAKLNKKKKIENRLILVEYHKQWKNFSIIIRRRKKQNSVVTSSIQSNSSNALCYYFQRVDSKEYQSGKRYEPKESIWDFPIHSKNSFFSQIKNLFFRK